ncbi:MAG: polysaccharide biosynthesis protein [bacterium]|nr:polysaccharide biosynthesis protein [bacterium]
MNLKRNSLITGTLLLTFTGFISRILGFVYRIFLSRTIGAEGLGIYQMIFPLYGICMAICASAIETAISRFVAANLSRTRSVLRTGFLISFSLSLITAGLIFCFSDFLAVHVLMEPRCAKLLPIMALAIPCTSIHDCICGCCYGSQKASIPGLSHLVELSARMITVFFLASYCLEHGIEITVTVAVYGLLAGEATSALFTLLSFLLSGIGKQKTKSTASHMTHTAGRLSFWQDFQITAASLMTMALPLIANRLVLSGLQSAEAILIPNRLSAFGLTSSEAISTYGTLTGMAVPFIMFPSTISTSLAVMLLPTVSQAQAAGNHSHIGLTAERSISFSLTIGILFTGIFILFGKDLGMTVFHSEAAGIYITILAWLCPFLYLCTTLGSILNGLGKTSTTFINQVAAQLLLLTFVVFGIPKFGIIAYLWGNLAAQLFLTALHIWALRREIPFSFHAAENLLKPMLCILVAVGIFLFFQTTIQPALPTENPWILLILEGGLYTGAYLLTLWGLHWSKK